MKFLYKKLNDYNQTSKETNIGFPLVVAGAFCDGMRLFPVFLYEQSEVVAEISAATILEADKQLLTTLGWKKIPADVVVTIEK